jgi:hypothetical protein
MTELNTNLQPLEHPNGPRVSGGGSVEQIDGGSQLEYPTGTRLVTIMASVCLLFTMIGLVWQMRLLLARRQLPRLT